MPVPFSKKRKVSGGLEGREDGGGEGMSEEGKNTRGGGEDGKMGEGVYSHLTPFFSSKPSHPAPLSNSPPAFFLFGKRRKSREEKGKWGEG